MAGQHTFQSAAEELFREAFEGVAPDRDYTWFVQGKEGVFDALDALDAGEASRRPTPGCATIAAHAYHLLYVLRCANIAQGRPAPQGSWEDTWRRQAVTEEEWRYLRRDIRAEYALFRDWLRENDDWSGEDAVLGALTPLPHVAFHLGAIRQVVRVLEDTRRANG